MRDGAYYSRQRNDARKGTFTMRLLLLGPQGAGKGTQAQRLAEITGARHISTGDLVRAEIEAGTGLGHTIQGYNDRGELVPDDIITQMTIACLRTLTSWILDGFPRSQAQASALDQALAEAGVAIDLVAALEAADTTMIERASGRRQSKATGRIYHLTNNPPPADDPGPFVQRGDDEPEKIRHRLAIYHAETEPLRDYYAARGILLTLDALQPIDVVTGTILRAVEDHTHASQTHRRQREGDRALSPSLSLT